MLVPTPDRLLYKALTRSCVFNDFKCDRKALFCVALLDLGKFVVVYFSGSPRGGRGCTTVGARAELI
jgi:hypothetical protein